MNENTSTSYPVLVAVCAALLLANIFQFFALLEQKDTMLQTQQNIISTKNQAKVAEEKLELLVRDLIELAKTNRNAEAIVKEFNIQLQAPSAQNQAAAAVDKK
jgi:hypothetical protein